MSNFIATFEVPPGESFASLELLRPDATHSVTIPVEFRDTPITRP